MQYFFILGTNPALSTAEICALFPDSDISLIGKEAIILETDQQLNPEQLINHMGGTIKIGEILFTEKSPNFDSILKNLQPHLVQTETGKYNFGISYYGQRKFDPHGLAMGVKKYWREKDVNSRWVVSKEKVLSSVVVEQNKLVSKGMEIVFIEDQNKLLIGKTLAVQPFKELSFRDFGRPSRDDRSGMIPPKLAQIMINLSSFSIAPSPCEGEERGEVCILDPFCGSGTIISEAILMGYKNLIGSDISEKAITDSENNIKWLENNFNIKDVHCRLFQSNVQSIAQKIKAKSVNAIITEPYLGPQRGNVDQQKIKIELEKLYSDAIQQFKKILNDNGAIVMIWPVFKNIKEDMKITPNIDGFKIISPIKKIPSSGGVAVGWGGFDGNQKLSSQNLTNRDTIIYGRPGQKVWREIVILKK